MARLSGFRPRGGDVAVSVALLMRPPVLEDGRSEDDGCTNCSHKRLLHDNKYGCVHEHDREYADGGIAAVQCFCDGFVGLRCRHCGVWEWVYDATPTECPNSGAGGHDWEEWKDVGIGSVAFAVQVLKLASEASEKTESDLNADLGF